MNETVNDLNWLAFRYVANELEPTEASEFESRLGEDQAAREAVARAVCETSQMHAAFDQQAVVSSSSSHDRDWKRSASRVIVVAGSCLSLLLAVTAARLVIQSPKVVVENPADVVVSGLGNFDNSTELALAWAEVSEGLDHQYISTDRNVDAIDRESNGTLAAEGDQALVAPSWMLAALATMNDPMDSNIEFQE